MKAKNKAKSKENRVLGTYRHYRIQANGSIVLVGDVEYERPAGTNEESGSDAGVWAYLEARNAADLARCERECASFEDLADRANEWEG